MLADDLAALQALAASGALSATELAAARQRAIDAFIAAPVAPPHGAGPLPVVTPAPQPPAANRVPGVPRYFGRIPPRMVPVALATGAGVLGGLAAGEAMDAIAGPAATDGLPVAIDPGPVA